MTMKNHIRPILLVGLFVGLVIVFLIFNRQNTKSVPQPQGEVRPQAIKSIVHTRQPYSYDLMKDDLEQIENKYKQVTKVTSIGRSLFGRNIYLASLGNGSRRILVTAGFHGREWMTSMLLVKMFEEYAAAAYNEQSIGQYQIDRLFEKTTLLFVPMLNPDGVEIALKGTKAGGDRDLLLRANEGSADFSRWKANGRGVNLNIQYRANWDKAVSNTRPHFEKYKGTKPESEPESKSLAALVRREKPDVVLCYHSSGEVVYWQYGQTGDRYRRDLAIAKEISRLTGYRLAKEPRLDAHGGFKDWFISSFKRPAFTIEIGRNIGDRPLPLTYFHEIWRENRLVVVDIAKQVSEIANQE